MGGKPLFPSWLRPWTKVVRWSVYLVWRRQSCTCTNSSFSDAYKLVKISLVYIEGFNLHVPIWWNAFTYYRVYIKLDPLKYKLSATQWRSKLNNWGGGAHIYTFMFFTVNFVWNRLFSWFVNSEIWICAPPPIIEFATPLLQPVLQGVPKNPENY